MSIPSGGIDIFGDGIGFLKLVQWAGDEKDIANAARVSFHKEVETFDLETDGKLLKWLLKQRHGTPFEQGFASWWHVRAPIFVFREWHRHRIGYSINEESGRYVVLRPDFYTCTNIRGQTGKPGAYKFETITDPIVVDKATKLIKAGQLACWHRYEDLMEMGIAKEVARQVLPLNIYSEMRWTANCRSLLNFLSLRADPHAMWEIRQYAEHMETIFAKNMPVVHEAFVEAGRIAP